MEKQQVTLEAPTPQPSNGNQSLIIQPKDALAVNRAPSIVLEEAYIAARALTDVIEKNTSRKKVKFNGKTYLQFEDWQTLGRFYGVTAKCTVTKYVTFGEGDKPVCGFEATADALLVGPPSQVVSSAEALCLNDEPNWKSKPLFQLKSMAQTRACAKALRNVLAWVVVLAGYAPTPAEEMDGLSFQEPEPPNTPSQTYSKIPGDVVLERCEWLANAKDLPELQRLFTPAYKDAAVMNDRAAMAAYIAAKDRRKKELQ